MMLYALGMAAMLTGTTEQPKIGQNTRYPQAKLLIEVNELSNPKISGTFRLLDTRSKKDFDAGHIAGAQWVDAAEWGKAFATGQHPEEWSKRIGDLGMDTDVPVIVYGDALTPDAGRIWWILRYWGIKDVRLLNGGWHAWQRENGTTVKERTSVSARQPKLTPQTDRLATKDQLLEALKKGQLQIVDARSAAEFCGEKELAKRNGAIPGAVHLEWIDVIDKKSQRFKSPEELAKLFRDKKIDLDQPTITHCQSGGRAAVMAFALELMGGKDVRNYYKSWSEWGNAEDTPIEKPKK
jgi:thiosulfate/3-mercaptopyruvate sulfurtransferase